MLMLTAVLMVGGQSVRMGRDKATLEWCREPLWQRQLRTLHSLGPEQLWVSARARLPWVPAQINVAIDLPPSRGPLSGLVATLKNLRTSHLLALAVDLPCMTVEHLAQLWRLCQPGCGVIPVIGDLFQPLCAIYPREALAAAEKQLPDGPASLQKLVRLLCEQQLMQSYRVSPPDQDLYYNLNTPAELETADDKRSGPRLGA
jgi:molybdenum cofactor guanylyltransferase